jgi:S-adenosylmethionine hydrolase
MALITLTTDFGETAPYVAVMKGVILSLNPAARLLDLSHRIRPQDISHANYFLGTAIPYFPPGTIHLCVIDPGVGGERAALVVQAGGQFLVGPDNGIFTNAVQTLGEPIGIWRLTESRFWRSPVSDTFHGRDVFAPAAAHLSLGVEPTMMGQPVSQMVRLENQPGGRVRFVDDFGNLITNIPATAVAQRPERVVLGERAWSIRWVRTYAEAEAGELVALTSSDGFFEIAVVNGNAAQRLNAAIGATVEL